MNAPRTDTILIVDDDEQLRLKIAQIAARSWALRPLVAGDYETGLALGRAHRPAFAVIDFQLLRGSGIDLIRALRAADKDMSLVLITGYGTMDLAAAATRAGANDVLGKPFTLQELAHKLLKRVPLPPAAEDTPAPFTIELLTWEHVQRVHREAGNKVLRTARLVGMDRKTVKKWLRMERPRR